MAHGDSTSEGDAAKVKQPVTESGLDPRPVMLCKATPQGPEREGQAMGDIPGDIMGRGEAREGLGQTPSGPTQADITRKSHQSPGSTTSICSFLDTTSEVIPQHLLLEKSTGDTLGWAGLKSQIQLRWGWAPGASIPSTELRASMALTSALGPCAIHPLLFTNPPRAVHAEVREARRQTSLEGLWQGTSSAWQNWGDGPQPRCGKNLGAGAQSAGWGSWLGIRLWKLRNRESLGLREQRRHRAALRGPASR